MEKMKNIFEDKEILVTGGTGSIGKEIVKTLLMFKPKGIRVLDTNENAQFDLQQEIGEHIGVRYFLGDTRDKERLCRAMEGVDIVYHLAGLKHVLACEYNPFEAVKTNVLGTQNLIDAVMIEGGVEKVIFSSSDKAVNPSNVMGATKLLAEKLITAANFYKGPRETTFSSVRFGNVVGSQGSVIPLFHNQIKAGGPVTVTDHKMTRYILSMAHSIDLLFKATEMAKGGEVFIFKMPAVKIINLAEVMVDHYAPVYNHDPADIEIEIIGAKSGEKMFEELLTADETQRAFETSEMVIVVPEMREFYPKKIFSDYHNATESSLNALGSKDEKLLSKKDLRKWLLKEKLL
jgi:FlaA1/EpsC-like NDP-sugar epimerase